MPELLVFKAGKYGQGDWPEERVKKFVDAYDPENLFEAPVVIGHRSLAFRDSDQYAHGWVKSLRMEKGGTVYANVPKFSAEAKQALSEGKLRYISVELYENDKSTKDQPPYLKSIALLGRDTPAVAGTKIPACFSLATGGVVSTIDEEKQIATFTRRVSADEIKLLSVGGDASGQGKNEEEAEMKTAEDLQAELEKSNARIAELEKGAAQAAAFAKENEALKSAGRKQDAEAFFAKLRDEGRLPPAQFEKAVALDARLGEEERKEMRAMFAAMDPKVGMTGKHAADKKNAPASGPETTLTAKISAYQKEHKLASYYDAAVAMQAEHPELFEEEGENV